MTASSFDLETPAGQLDRAQAETLAAGLREEIHRHSYLYYVEARPEISDGEYDRLYRRLQLLETAFPHLVTVDSPTQRVGTEPRDDLPTVRHAAPMLSLDSSDQEAALRRFDDRIRKAVDEPIRYLLEPKLDGASMELVYEEGVLVLSLIHI